MLTSHLLCYSTQPKTDSSLSGKVNLLPFLIHQEKKFPPPLPASSHVHVFRLASTTWHITLFPHTNKGLRSVRMRCQCTERESRWRNKPATHTIHPFSHTFVKIYFYHTTQTGLNCPIYIFEYNVKTASKLTPSIFPIKQNILRIPHPSKSD